MYGLFQTLFYFGYMALGSAALGILCGKDVWLLLWKPLWLFLSSYRYRWLYWNKLLCEENLLNSEDWLKYKLCSFWMIDTMCRVYYGYIIIFTVLYYNLYCI